MTAWGLLSPPEGNDIMKGAGYMAKKRRSGSDEGWKMILDRYFPEFLEFYFPNIYQDIELDRIEFVGTDFVKITKDSEVGSRYADKIAKVVLKEGGEKILLVHVEVQGEPEKEFERRLYTYNYRIYERFGTDVVTLVVLTGNTALSGPFCFEFRRWGFHAYLRVSGGEDWSEYRDRVGELEKSVNPFAVVTLTHLRFLEAYGNDDVRLFWKKVLVKSLYRRGYSREDILNLYYFIDWVIALPEEMETKFSEDIHDFEEGMNMVYVSSMERLGLKKGHQKGLEEGLEKGLEKGKLETAENMFKAGYDRETVKKLTGLTDEQLAALGE